MYPSPVELLKHILDECNYLIKESSSNSYSEFVKDERLSKAICRSLEIIGEASIKINPDLKAKYPYIPWREMSDLRNRIIHHYFGIDFDIVWDTIQTDIPFLKAGVETILNNELNK